MTIAQKIGFSEFLATYFAAVAQDHQGGFSVETDVVEKIGGQSPQSLENFIKSHQAMMKLFQISSGVSKITHTFYLITFKKLLY